MPPSSPGTAVVWAAPGATGWRVLALLLLCAAAAMAVLTPYDQHWVLFLAQFREPRLLVAMNSTVFEGGSAGFSDWVLLVFVAVMIPYGLSAVPGLPPVLRRWRAEAGYLMACGLCTGITVQALKALVARPRPLQVLEGTFSFVPWYVPGSLPFIDQWKTGSFPSGHTATAAVLAAFALVLLRNGQVTAGRVWIGVTIGLTALMAFSRILSQDHWPTDTVGGAVLGFGIPWVLWRLRRVPAPGDPLAGHAQPGWTAHPAGQGAWAARFVMIYLGLALSVTAAVIALRALPQHPEGRVWGILAAGVAGSLLFAWRGVRLFRPPVRAGVHHP